MLRSADTRVPIAGVATAELGLSARLELMVKSGADGTLATARVVTPVSAGEVSGTRRGALDAQAESMRMPARGIPLASCIHGRLFGLFSFIQFWIGMNSRAIDDYSPG
jgi:hypothetical protein